MNVGAVTANGLSSAGNTGSNTQLRALRKKWFTLGEPPVAGSISTVVSNSWQRCIQTGLDPFSRQRVEHILPAEILKVRIEQRRELIEKISPSIEYLYSLIQGAGSVIALADNQGVIIHTVGDCDFLNKADQVLLKPGASWTERHRGTNAIGTAISEGNAVSINGSEHYFDANGFLTCAAVPIHSSSGSILGVLDISSDYRAYHPHTLGLVKTTVDRIEKQLLFDARPPSCIAVAIHPQVSGLGTLAEGVLFVDEAGQVQGANAAALNVLGMRYEQMEELKIDQFLQLPWRDILGRALRGGTETIETKNYSGKRFFCKLDYSYFTTALPTHHLHNMQTYATATTGQFNPAPELDMGKTKLRELQKHSVVAALLKNDHNVARTAKELGISRTTLYRYLNSND